ncbi:MAG TPA: C25 family peptidase propeptide domain-containing protein, partial [Bacteroidota bacterium]|nr:C25 family peptidase propeptide domain-containing protein [Bacteroidota bacterium]
MNLISLPKESFFIGIPPTGTPTLSILSKETKQETGVEIATMPHLRVSEDPIPSVTRIFSESVSEDVPTTNGRPAIIRGIFWLRYQRIAAIEVDPLQYDSRTKTLTRNL